MAKLYIVATPIGNLEDISRRALRILNEVDLILCEDTRVTKKLLSKYDIHTKTRSYHSHSSLSKVEDILSYLKDGKDIALVSDAGTPAISDPGSKLVSHVQNELPETEIISIPGPSAVAAALSISGLPASEFLFLGFLPRKKGREKLFTEITKSKRTVVFYESPHRIAKTLSSLSKTLQSDRKVVIARELTKVYEEIVSGSAKELLSYILENKEKERGEFVVMIEPLRSRHAVGSASDT